MMGAILTGLRRSTLSKLMPREVRQQPHYTDTLQTPSLARLQTSQTRQANSHQPMKTYGTLERHGSRSALLPKPSLPQSQDIFSAPSSKLTKQIKMAAPRECWVDDVIIHQSPQPTAATLQPRGPSARLPCRETPRAYRSHRSLERL